MEEEIERVQIGQFETLDFTLANTGEVVFDTLSRDLSHKHRIKLGFECNQPDICRITFIARAGMCDLDKLHFHLYLPYLIALFLPGSVIGHGERTVRRIDRHSDHMRGIVLLIEIGDEFR
jgi:hypothetical protein